MHGDADPAQSILIVEDDDDIRDTLLRLLVEEGYQASACSNGFEALERLRLGHRADVILLDLMMPVMDGWEFRVHQKADPRMASIPVLAISADTSAKAAAIDAEAYLRKPIDYDTLIGSVERALIASERRRLQATLAEAERLVALGTLAAGVAHEINNPLAYVMANRDYVAMILDNEDSRRNDAAVRDALGEMRDGCERIRTIVHDLRLLSRPADDKNDAVDVRRVLDSSANIVMNQIRARARLTKDYADVPPITGSAARLGQVFLNLVLNAAQAIREGSPATNEIRLKTREEGGKVVVEIADTGAGIPLEVRRRIFDPFFTTKPVGAGTGLGLSISRGIVSAMGGEITVDSELGSGTTFRVYLPATEPVAARAAPRVEVHPAARARLLVIDDEGPIAVALQRILGSAYEVDAMTNPEAALARIRAGERFDLILCDLMMPGRSGMDVYAEVQIEAPEQARRMVFLTGGTCSTRAAEFLAEPGRIVIEKPFNLDSLLAAIGGALAMLERAN